MSATETVWTMKIVNDLPDSSFAYIEPGGSKDAVGKTVPRSLRHLPFKTESGDVEPFLLEKALEQVEKSALSASTQKRVKAKLEEYAKGGLEKAESSMPCPCGDGACGGVQYLKSMTVEASEAALGVEKYITGSGNKWHVHAESGKVLGTHGSKGEAVAQLRAIEWHKAHPTAKDEATTWPRGPESADKPRIEKPKETEKDVHWPVDDSRFRGSSLTDAGQKAPNQTKKMIDVLKEQEPGSRAIALYFDKALYPTEKDVLSWVNDHGFSKAKVVTAKDGYRVMQSQEPVETSRTIQLTEGVSASIGIPTKTVEAIKEAFFLTTSGRLAFKAEELQTAECEPVSETSDGTIWRVKCGSSTFHFAEQDGVAAYIPFYGAQEYMKHATFFIPVSKAVGGQEQRYTLSVVYPASKKGSPEPDFHGDVMSEEELEKSAWGFMNKGTDRIGLMHRPGTSGAGKVVESYIWRGPEWKMKDAGGKEQAVSPGDWVMGIVWEPAAWQAIKSGQITGLSLQGAARKEAF
jgi:hypothetical protein